MTRGGALALVVALAVVAAAPAQQPATAPAPDDLGKTLRDAIGHSRYGARLAAARKLAAAGDAAVPVLKAHVQAHGLDAIPMQVVDALATADADGPELRALLARWADEPAFFWRSLALRGLVERRDESSHARFVRATEDPSHLMRIQGGRGLWNLARDADREPVLALLEDPDPRVPVPVAVHLLEQGDERGVPLLEQALTWRDEFLGDAWGLREAQAARKALAKAFPDRELPKLEPAAAERGAAGWVGGLELRSCRHGDLFLRWTEAGHVAAGLRESARVQLDAEDARLLLQELTRLPGKPIATHGNVVCDFLQASGPGIRQKAAPGALPTELTDWLAELEDALWQAPELQAALRQRLPQFTGASR